MWDNLNHFYWQSKSVKIYCEDVLSALKKLSDESIQMSMCSPPYWGLRNYGIEGQYGLEATPQDYINNMRNVFKEIYRVLKKDGTCWINIGDTYCSSPSGNKFNDKHQVGDGLYGRLIDRNAMQEDNAKNIISGRFDKENKTGLSQHNNSGRGKGGDYKDKCMLMMPERFSFMMIDLGYILRNKIIWYKRNAMPSSVKDRFTCTWEYVYFFSKSRRYYFDLDSVRILPKISSIKRYNYPPFSDYAKYKNRANVQGLTEFFKKQSFNYRVRDAEKKKDQCPQFKASEEEILKYKDKGLVKVKNLHGECNEQGRRIQLGLRSKIPQEQCETFGNSRARNYRNKTADQSYKVGGMRPYPELNDPKYKKQKYLSPEEVKPTLEKGIISGSGRIRAFYDNFGGGFNPFGKNPGDMWDIATKGYKSAHFAVYSEKLCEIPIKAGSRPGDIVLDPFAGSFTTGVVALKLKRKFIGIELSKIYVDTIGIPRIEKTEEEIKSLI